MEQSTPQEVQNIRCNKGTEAVTYLKVCVARGADLATIGAVAATGYQVHTKLALYEHQQWRSAMQPGDYHALHTPALIRHVGLHTRAAHACYQ
jgi:hypothetical protein